jgi:hypothetical protein
MFIRFFRSVCLVLIFVGSQTGCRTKESKTANRATDQVLIGSKQYVVGPGQYVGTDDPPCIRRGMEDVGRIAKNFAAQQGTQSFGFVRKDTPAAPLTLSAPSDTAGPSLIVDAVQNTLPKTGGNAADAGADKYASCGTIAFVLPKNIGQVRAMLTAGNETEAPLPCATVQGQSMKCDVGSATWTFFREDRYFVATFKNWSENLSRTAKIDLYPIN